MSSRIFIYNTELENSFVRSTKIGIANTWHDDISNYIPSIFFDDNKYKNIRFKNSKHDSVPSIVTLGNHLRTGTEKNRIDAIDNNDSQQFQQWVSGSE